MAPRNSTPTRWLDFRPHDRSRQPDLLIAKSGGVVGGLFDISGHDFDQVPESWMSYIAVDDADARVAKAVKAGAQVMKPAFDIPGWDASPSCASRVAQAL